MCFGFFVRIECELISRRSDEIKFLQIHISTNCRVLLCILGMYLQCIFMYKGRTAS